MPSQVVRWLTNAAVAIPRLYCTAKLSAKINLHRHTKTTLLIMRLIKLYEAQMMWCVFRPWKVLAFCTRWRSILQNCLLQLFEPLPTTTCTRNRRCTYQSSWVNNYYLNVCHICITNCSSITKTMKVTLTVYKIFEHTHDVKMNSTLP